MSLHLACTTVLCLNSDFLFSQYLAISDAFEIKPLGSAYPAQTTTGVSVATNTASGSGSGTAPSATATPKSGAASLVPHSVWAAAGLGLGAIALVAGLA